MYATPGLKAQDLGRYYKDSTFGVKPGDIASTHHATRRRDDPARQRLRRAAHLRHHARGTMFGAGYAAAQDRLFFIDVLRHLGRAELSSFIGGAPANRAMDAEQWSTAPVHRGRLPAPVRPRRRPVRRRGRRLQDDAAELRRGRQPVHRRGAPGPDQDAGRVRRARAAAGARRLEGDRPLLHRLARRRDLRQGRRARAGGGPAAGRVQGPLRRQEGPHALGAVRRLRRPRRPDHRAGQRFPYQTKPKRKAKGAEEPPDRGSFKALDVARPQAAPRGRPRRGDVLPGGNLRLRSPARCPRRCPTRCSCRAPSSASRATRSPCSARRSPTSPRRSSWRRTCTARASTPAAPPSPA